MTIFEFIHCIRSDKKSKENHFQESDFMINAHLKEFLELDVFFIHSLFNICVQHLI